MRSHADRVTLLPIERRSPIRPIEPSPDIQTGTAQIRPIHIVPSAVASQAELSVGVLLIGSPAHTRSAQARLEAQDGGLLRCTNVQNISSAKRHIATGRFDLVLYIAPLTDTCEDATIEDAVALLREVANEESPPVNLALVPDDFQEERVRTLYALGLKAVLVWPDDLPPLPSIVQQMMVGHTSEQAALEEAARTRLGVRFEQAGREIEIHTRRNTVKISGSVHSMSEKRELKHHADRTPGIEHVDISSVAVVPLVRHTDVDSATDD
jgi:hypothetical protein